MDALAIDWSVLMQKSKQPATTGSALLRFQPAAIFRQIGVSRQYAGEELFQKIKKLCETGKQEGEKGKVPYVEEYGARKCGY